jgi:hypothetical protein
MRSKNGRSNGNGHGNGGLFPDDDQQAIDWNSEPWVPYMRLPLALIQLLGRTRGLLVAWLINHQYVIRHKYPAQRGNPWSTIDQIAAELLLDREDQVKFLRQLQDRRLLRYQSEYGRDGQERWRVELRHKRIASELEQFVAANRASSR